MRTLKFVGSGFIFIIMFFVGLSFIPIQGGVESIDFKNYYNDAGMPSYRDVLSDPEDVALQELISWSIFHDVDVSISHTAERHPGDQSLYKECMDHGNTIMGFASFETDHCVEVMSTTVEEGGRKIEKFLVRVVKQTKDKFYEITAFSDEWEGVWEVEEYLISNGYFPIWP